MDDDDNDKLPVDLQYLEPEKTRESDPDIRLMLVEAINQVRYSTGLILAISDGEKNWISKFSFSNFCSIHFHSLSIVLIWLFFVLVVHVNEES